VEVKGIGSPCEESDKEVEPILQAELSEQADGILERLWLLPLAVLLAVVIANDYTLVPSEEILETLFGGGDDTLRQWVCWAVGARHGADGNLN